MQLPRLLPHLLALLLGCNAVIDVDGYRFDGEGGAAGGQAACVPSSDTSEIPLSIPDLALWLDATDLPVGEVARWLDRRCGAAIEASQENPAAQPQVTVSPRTAVVFDGTNDYLQANSTLEGPLTLFVVTHHYDDAPLGTCQSGREASPILSTKNSASGQSGIALTTRNTYLDDSLSLRVDSGAGTDVLRLAKDGVDVSLADLTVGTPVDTEHAFVVSLAATVSGQGGPLRLGTFANGCFFGRGRVSEILVYTRVLELAEQVEIEAYLREKWGI